MTLTLEQIIALENYVLLGRRASGETGVLEKFRAAKSVLDDAGLTKQADALSHGYDLADAILALARERLQAGTFQQALDAAAKVCDVERLSLERERQDWNMDVDQRQINAAKIESAKKCAHAIRNLKPEQSNG